MQTQFWMNDIDILLSGGVTYRIKFVICVDI